MPIFGGFALFRRCDLNLICTGKNFLVGLTELFRCGAFHLGGGGGFVDLTSNSTPKNISLLSNQARSSSGLLVGGFLMAHLISFLTIRDRGCCGGNVESDMARGEGSIRVVGTLGLSEAFSLRFKETGHWERS